MKQGNHRSHGEYVLDVGAEEFSRITQFVTRLPFLVCATATATNNRYQLVGMTSLEQVAYVKRRLTRYYRDVDIVGEAKHQPARPQQERQERKVGMEQIQTTSVEVTSYTLADAQILNTIKNRVRDITRLLDVAGKAYPPSLEAHQVKHEVVVLLTELQIHGLLPDTVTIAEGSHAETRVAGEET